MSKQCFRFSLLTLLLLVSGCAVHYTPESVDDPYGFFSGIWHGIVFPYALMTNILSWILGLFGFSVLDSIQVIGRPNSGAFYYLGFGLGVFSYSGAAAR